MYVDDKQLMRALRDAVKSETNAGIAKWGHIKNDLERYAIIKGELEETQAELDKVFVAFEEYWDAVKRNNKDDMMKYRRWIEQNAKHVIFEMIQTIGASYSGRDDIHEL
jgi:hypothetical protein